MTMEKTLLAGVGGENQPPTKKAKLSQNNAEMYGKTAIHQSIDKEDSSAAPRSFQQRSTNFEGPCHQSKSLTSSYLPTPLQSRNMAHYASDSFGKHSISPNSPASPFAVKNHSTRGLFVPPQNHSAMLAKPVGDVALGTQSIFFPITPTDYNGDYMGKLRSLVHPPDILSKKGYILDSFTREELEKKKRCKHCTKLMKHYEKFKPQDVDKAEAAVASSDRNGNSGQTVIGSGIEYEQQTASGNKKSMFSDIWEQEKAKVSSKGKPQTIETPVVKNEPILRCKFHDGSKKNGAWSCCKKKYHEEGCRGNEHHIPREYPHGELESIWQCYPTPSFATSYRTRSAVAIDCEMGISKSNDSELIRVTVVDYFTSEKLVDSLVYPDVPILHYNTRYSGVTPQQMNEATKNGLVLRGKKAAREAVWRFVGPDTVVVGHSAQNDLMALRWIHSVVVDTMLIDFLKEEKRRQREVDIKATAEKAVLKEGTEEHEAVAENEQGSISSIKDRTMSIEATSLALGDDVKVDVPKVKKPRGGGQFSLKSMALVKLGRQIQMAGTQGHDSVEDAIAARDIAHWHVLNKALHEEDLIEFSDDDA